MITTYRLAMVVRKAVLAAFVASACDHQGASAPPGNEGPDAATAPKTSAGQGAGGAFAAPATSPVGPVPTPTPTPPIDARNAVAQPNNPKDNPDAAPPVIPPPPVAKDGPRAVADAGRIDTRSPVGDTSAADSSGVANLGKSPPQQQPAGTDPVSILFIGNSYTYVNDLNLVLTQLAASKRILDTERETPGGQSLQGHYGDGTGAGPTAIKKRKWDFVVLQEQSMTPVGNRGAFLKYAALLDKMVDERGAQTVFYGTWSQKSALADQPKFDDAYRTAARAAEAYLSPVGAAWARVRSERPDLELFADDGSHPSYAGTYLGACVFYGVILGTSPVGAPALKMSPADAAYLQKTAAQTLSTFNF